MRAGVLVCALLSCARVPKPAVIVPTGLEVSHLTVAFPREEQGDLFFEVVLPAGLLRVGSVRWALSLQGRRFATGLVMTPEVTADVSGLRRVRVEAPLHYRHLVWRDGSSFLDVRLEGDLVPLGADDRRLPFRAQTELLVSGVPVID